MADTFGLEIYASNKLAMKVMRTDTDYKCLQVSRGDLCYCDCLNFLKRCDC